MEKRGRESEVLEGHPLSARFLGSHPLTTKGPGRAELDEGGQERGGAHSQKAMFPPLLEAFTPPPPAQWQQLESAIIPSSAI